LGIRPAAAPGEKTNWAGPPNFDPRTFEYRMFPAKGVMNVVVVAPVRAPVDNVAWVAGHTKPRLVATA
jgi:hypothetical protein